MKTFSDNVVVWANIPTQDQFDKFDGYQGKLSFDPERGGQLELVFVNLSREFAAKTDYLFAFGQKGKFYTLKGALCTKKNFGTQTGTNSTLCSHTFSIDFIYESSTVFLDNHFLVSTVKFETDSGSGFLNRRSFMVDSSAQGQSGVRLEPLGINSTISMYKGSNFEIKAIPLPKACPPTLGSVSDYTMEDRWVFQISYENPANLDEADTDCFCFLLFMSLGLQHYVTLRELRYIDNAKRSYEFFSRSRHTKNSVLDAYSSIYRFDSFEDFQSAYSKWIELFEKMPRLVETQLDSIRIKRFDEYDFLRLTLSAVHVVRGFSVKDDGPGFLKYAIESYSGCFFKRKLDSSAIKIISDRAAQTRNDICHPENKRPNPKRLTTFEEQYNVAILFRLVSLVYILKRIGLSEQEIDGYLMTTNRRTYMPDFDFLNQLPSGSN